MEIMGIPDVVIDNFILPNGIGAIPSVARTPFFGFAQLFQAEDSISSNYNSLQVKLDKRFSHGLSSLLAYTWSHSIDGASVFLRVGRERHDHLPAGQLQPKRRTREFRL